jgi:hypothetical protein
MEYTTSQGRGIFPDQAEATDMAHIKLTPELEQAVNAVVASMEAEDSMPPVNASETEMISWRVGRHMRSPEVQKRLHKQVRADVEAFDRGENPFATQAQPAFPAQNGGMRSRFGRVIACLFT